MKYFFALIGLISMPTFAADLQVSDTTGITFWLVTAAMLAATVFFFAERDTVKGKWKTSLSVAGLVTGIAFWHYLYMRGVWVDTGTSPTVYRYIDWLITVPLLMVEFYLILAACTNVAGSLFKKLLVGSLVMLLAGYMGESGAVAAMPAFVVGVLAWFYMIYELYAGEGKAAVTSASPAVMSAYNTMMAIIVVGWAIYPAGYAAGYLMGGEGVYAANLNIVYNLADFVNKILFGLVIWHVAVKESASA